MTQTIKERLKLLKKRNPELNEYADNYAQHIYVRNKGFNEGVDACLPLLEEVLQTRICNRKGIHTCRAGAFHLPEMFNGTIEDILKLIC